MPLELRRFDSGRWSWRSEVPKSIGFLPLRLNIHPSLVICTSKHTNEKKMEVSLLLMSKKAKIIIRKRVWYVTTREERGRKARSDWPVGTITKVSEKKVRPFFFQSSPGGIFTSYLSFEIELTILLAPVRVSWFLSNSFCPERLLNSSWESPHLT